MAGVSPKLTAVVPVKYCPRITTELPLAAVIGEKALITGLYKNVNIALDVAVPPGVTTVILPVSPLPKTAVICVEEFTVKLATAVPPQPTAVAPLKFAPVITIDAPLAAEVGLKPVIVGLVTTVNVPAEVAVPLGVVILMFPVLPLPTVAVIIVAELTVKLAAAVPPKLTAVAPVRFVPFIVTTVPLAPDVGVNVPMIGAAPVPDILK